MKVINYARVSTDDKEQDPERQLMKGRQYCELHGHEVIAELIDHYTGDSYILDRPEGSRLKNYPNAEGLICFSIDRYSRQHPTKVLRQLSEWKDKGFKIISVTEPIFNMEGEFSDLLMYLLTWTNNYYLAKLKKDIKSGLERARQQGKQIGRKKAEFNRFRAYHLLFEAKKPDGRSYSQREIADELGVSLATINRFKTVAAKSPDLFKKPEDVS